MYLICTPRPAFITDNLNVTVLNLCAKNQTTVQEARGHAVIRAL